MDAPRTSAGSARERAADGAPIAPAADAPAGTVDGAAGTLVSMLDAAFAAYRMRAALHFAGAALGYGELDASSQALAAWLQHAGFARGERVALLLPNRPAFVVAALAAWRAGGVVVPLDPALPEAALRHQLEDAGARTVVLAESCATAFEPLQAALALPRVLTSARADLLRPWWRPFVNRGERVAHAGLRLPGALRLAEALARGRRLGFTPPAIAGDDIALLQYTGGITAPARAAVLRHRNLVANVGQCAAWMGPAFARAPAGEPLHWLCALPLHQIFAFTLALLLPLHLGACVRLHDDAGDARALLRALARRRVHVLPAVGPMFAGWLDEPAFERVDWSALVLALSGGVALPPAAARRWHAATGCPIVEGYGLAEASPAVSCNPPLARDETGTLAGVGRPLPGTEIRLLDEAGAPVAPGQLGEVAVRGPQVMAGYWQRPDETARAMTAEGFLRTGDIGALDDQGHLHLHGRRSEMILVSGFHVAPAEVEEVLARLPGVRECAVVGVSDERIGQAVKAVLVKSDPASPLPSEADVRAWCETHLTGYKRPRIVEFRAELPRSRLGTPIRRALRDDAD